MLMSATIFFASTVGHWRRTRAEQALLLGGHRDEQHRAAQLRAALLQHGRDVEHGGHPRGVVHRAVVDRVAVDRLADAQVIEMRREDNVLVLELGRCPAARPRRSARPRRRASPPPSP